MSSVETKILAFLIGAFVVESSQSGYYYKNGLDFSLLTSAGVKVKPNRFAQLYRTTDGATIGHSGQGTMTEFTVFGTEVPAVLSDTSKRGFEIGEHFPDNVAPEILGATLSSADHYSWSTPFDSNGNFRDIYVKDSTTNFTVSSTFHSAIIPTPAAINKVNIYIDGNMVKEASVVGECLNNPSGTATCNFTTPIQNSALTAGQHEVQLEYVDEFENVSEISKKAYINVINLTDYRPSVVDLRITDSKTTIYSSSIRPNAVLFRDGVRDNNDWYFEVEMNDVLTTLRDVQPSGFVVKINGVEFPVVDFDNTNPLVLKGKIDSFNLRLGYDLPEIDTFDVSVIYPSTLTTPRYTIDNTYDISVTGDNKPPKLLGIDYSVDQNLDAIYKFSFENIDEWLKELKAVP